MNVFLPQTKFPPRRNSAADIITSDSWDFSSDSNSRVLDGPPYANGNIHLGHAVNKILKDFVVRQIRHTALRPGWDCHGLPIEWKIEEELRAVGVNKNDMTPADFRRRCRDFAMQWVGTQREQFKELGIRADWDNPYLTMAPESELTILRQLHDLVRANRLYTANKPVLWSPIEKTALASAETVDREHVVNACYVRFGCVSGPLMGVDVLVWTTTPWSLPGNRALAFNESIAYGLYTATGGYVVIAKALADKFPDMEFVRDVPASHLLASRAVNPMYEFPDSVPFLSASYVRETTGTGIVHVGPANSVEDWALWRCHFPSVAVPDLLDEAGRFHMSVPVVGGLLVTKGKKFGPANDAVLAAMGDRLYLRDEHTMTLQHSWRSDALLITNATRQVFIMLGGLDTEAAIEKIAFFPMSSKQRFVSMTESRPDWLVSRQRLWGTPLAIIVSDANVIVSDDRVLRAIEAHCAEFGMDSWWDTDVSLFLPPSWDASKYHKVMDVLDVWFDSACANIIAPRDLNYEVSHGANRRTVIEGTDQHRGFFSSMFFLALALGHAVPFDTVVTHGFVMHAPGQKMEKSKGTGLRPSEIIANYGPDTLRLWVAMTNSSQDMVFSNEAMKNAEESYRKLRNTFKYLLGALDGYAFDEFHLQDTDAIDLHILLEMQNTKNRAHNAVGVHDFTAYMVAIQKFCISDLSQMYFDVRKDRLYCDAINDPRRNACLAVMTLALENLMLLLEPIVPHLVAEVAKHHVAKSRNWVVRTNAGTAVGELLGIRDGVRKLLEEARREGKIGSSTDAIVSLPGNSHPLLADLLIVSEVREGPEKVFAATDCGYLKCTRCWKYYETLNDDLCQRCETVNNSQS